MHTQHYLVTLKSGRTFVLKSGYDVYKAAYDAVSRVVTLRTLGKEGGGFKGGF